MESTSEDKCELKRTLNHFIYIYIFISQSFMLREQSGAGHNKVWGRTQSASLRRALTAAHWCPQPPGTYKPRAGARQRHSADTLKVVSMAYLSPNTQLFSIGQTAWEPCLLTR